MSERSRHKGFKSAIILDGVSEIESFAFHNCETLTSVTIPANVNHIGLFAFSDCTNLTDVTFQGDFSSVSDSMFQNCTNLKRVTCHGMTISSADYEKVNMLTVLKMTANRNYNVTMPVSAKFDIIWRTYFADADDTAYLFIQKNLPKMFKFLADKNDTEAIHKVFDSGKFNEARLFRFLIDKNYPDIFVKMLPHAEKGKIEILIQYATQKGASTIIRSVLDSGEYITKENIDDFILYAIDKKSYEIQVMLTNHKAQKEWYEDQETIIRKKFSL